MTIREKVFLKLNVLDEGQLKQVAEYLDFLKFRESRKSKMAKTDSLKDTIFNIGKNPVETGVNDASENLDKYLY